MYFDNFDHVPVSLWRWPNFMPQEIACKGNGALLISEPAMDALQSAREFLNQPMIIINSAYRSPSYNKQIGGAKYSRHLAGIAFDIALEGHEYPRLINVLQKAGFQGFGFYDSFIHADMGRKRYWFASTSAEKVWKPFV